MNNDMIWKVTRKGIKRVLKTRFDSIWWYGTQGFHNVPYKAHCSYV